MKNQTVVRDERYYTVENASYRIGYMILMYGLMLLIIFRSIAYHESSWDLFALVFISSAAATLYQIVHKILPFSRKYIYLFLGTALVAAIASVIISLLGK